MINPSSVHCFEYFCLWQIYTFPHWKLYLHLFNRVYILTYLFLFHCSVMKQGRHVLNASKATVPATSAQEWTRRRSTFLVLQVCHLISFLTTLSNYISKASEQNLIFCCDKLRRAHKSPFASQSIKRIYRGSEIEIKQCVELCGQKGCHRRT